VISATASSRQPRGGPPPLVPALAYGVLMIASVAVAAGGPRTSTPAAQALQYARDHAGLLHASAVLGFAAALPLAIWTAVAYHRLRSLGVTAPGAVMGLVGGTLAAGSMALSGLITSTTADAASTADPGLEHALVDLGFLVGGAGFVVPFALLVAGIAVPALLLRLIPRPLALIGLAIAIVGMLSTFTILTSAMDATLPIGRFGGLAWITAASITLPLTRHRDTIQPAQGVAA